MYIRQWLLRFKHSPRLAGEVIGKEYETIWNIEYQTICAENEEVAEALAHKIAIWNNWRFDDLKELSY